MTVTSGEGRQYLKKKNIICFTFEKWCLGWTLNSITDLHILWYYLCVMSINLTCLYLDLRTENSFCTTWGEHCLRCGDITSCEVVHSLSLGPSQQVEVHLVPLITVQLDLKGGCPWWNKFVIGQKIPERSCFWCLVGQLLNLITFKRSTTYL